MKREIKCYRCGRVFLAEEGVRSDICPGCLSFIEVARARQNFLDGQDIPAGEASKDREEAAVPPDKAPSPEGQPEMMREENAESKETLPREEPVRQTAEEHPQDSGEGAAQRIAAREEEPSEEKSGSAREEKRKQLMLRAQEALKEKKWALSASLWKMSLAIRNDWRAHFGFVLARTRDLSDFSDYGQEEEEHAGAALSGADGQRRAALASAYLPKLGKLRAELAQREEALQRDLQSVHAERQGTKAKKKGNVWQRAALCSVILMFLLFFAVFIVVPLQGFSGAAIGILASFFVFFILTAVFFAMDARRKKMEKRAEQAIQEVDAMREEKLNRELSAVRRQIDAVDFICGSIKY